MLGWRRSGLRPAPSGSTVAARSNGFSRNTSSVQKKTAKPSRTAVAYGATSRARRRVRNRIRLLHRLRSITHSRSEPSWLDHTAVAR